MTPVHVCPTCNQKVSADRMLIDLQSNTVSFAGVARRLTPTEAEILDVLWATYPQVVRTDAILSRIDGITGETTYKSFRQHMCHLRKKLRGMPIAIMTVWGNCYRLMLGAEI